MRVETFQLGRKILPPMVVAVGQLLGRVNLPTSKAAFERRKPLGQTRLAGVDLLPSADQANDDAPSSCRSITLIRNSGSDI